ncbi:MAG: hypothetical protein HOP19_08840 [Acidobacteria bacterium]|nr:hypothetical protein [Acidobacteriota bacterium]
MRRMIEQHNSLRRAAQGATQAASLWAELCARSNDLSPRPSGNGVSAIDLNATGFYLTG